jgi:hypothetical protein
VAPALFLELFIFLKTNLIFMSKDLPQEGDTKVSNAIKEYITINGLEMTII